MNMHKVGFSALLSMLFLSVSAQRGSVPQYPPVLGNARSVFLGAVLTGTARDNMTYYSSLYGALTGHGYTVAATPAEADIVLEFSSQSETVLRGDSVPDQLAMLSVFDSKTHTLLWRFDEPVHHSPVIDTHLAKDRLDAALKTIDDLSAMRSVKP